MKKAINIVVVVILLLPLFAIAENSVSLIQISSWSPFEYSFSDSDMQAAEGASDDYKALYLMTMLTQGICDYPPIVMSGDEPTPLTISKIHNTFFDIMRTCDVSLDTTAQMSDPASSGDNEVCFIVSFIVDGIATIQVITVSTPLQQMLDNCAADDQSNVFLYEYSIHQRRYSQPCDADKLQEYIGQQKIEGLILAIESPFDNMPDVKVIKEISE